MCTRTCSILLAALIGFILIPIHPARAREPRDPLKEVKERQEAERQRVTAKCQEAHDEATKVAGAHPAKALMILKTMREQIDTDADLSPQYQLDLERWLDYRIRWLTLRIQHTEALRDWLNHGTPSGKSQEKITDSRSTEEPR